MLVSEYIGFQVPTIKFSRNLSVNIILVVWNWLWWVYFYQGNQQRLKIRVIFPQGAGCQIFQFSSVAQWCPTLCDAVSHSTPALPVHHQLQEFTQTHIHRVSDAIQPSHPLSSPSPPAPNPSQYQSLFQWVNSSHELAKVLEFQL